MYTSDAASEAPKQIYMPSKCLHNNFLKFIKFIVKLGSYGTVEIVHIVAPRILVTRPCGCELKLSDVFASHLSSPFEAPWENKLDARRVHLDFHFVILTMPEATDFSIKVPSEDPKKKDVKDSEKDKEEGSSRLLKDDKKTDGKEGEGEELVCVPCVFVEVFVDIIPVGRGSTTAK